ncbi:hypothetical protein C1H46_012445 [Malus baccata]|uniref:Uncharacterized protein n=1 Tax=Malus baccata TaxID=106549 RepID=A0A540MT20_MALBA|nr:hypothetical protein C1H46_012445 [Malus baccata]
MQVAAKNFTLCNGLSKSNNPFIVLSLTQSTAFNTHSNPLNITFIATFTSPSNSDATSPFLAWVASWANSTILMFAIATCCLTISLSTLSSLYLNYSTFITCSSDMETSLVVFSNSTSWNIIDDFHPVTQEYAFSKALDQTRQKKARTYSKQQPTSQCNTPCEGWWLSTPKPEAPPRSAASSPTT